MFACRGQFGPRGPSLRSEGIRFGDVGREGRSLSRTSPPRHPCTGNRVGNGTLLPPPVPRSHHCPPPSGSCQPCSTNLTKPPCVCFFCLVFFFFFLCLNPSLPLTSWLTGLDCAAAVGWWQTLPLFHENKKSNLTFHQEKSIIHRDAWCVFSHKRDTQFL